MPVDEQLGPNVTSCTWKVAFAGVSNASFNGWTIYKADTVQLASSHFHKLVQIDEEIGDDRFDYANGKNSRPLDGNN